MSFRHDKIRGNHPITPKKGIKETDLNIKEKGMNDTIKVSIKPKTVTRTSTLTGKEIVEPAEYESGKSTEKFKKAKAQAINYLQKIIHEQKERSDKGWSNSLDSYQKYLEMIEKLNGYPTDSRQMRDILPSAKAKILKAQLEDTFPNTQWKIQTENYSGGNSINASYVGGEYPYGAEKIGKLYSDSGDTDTSVDYFDVDTYVHVYDKRHNNTGDPQTVSDTKVSRLASRMRNERAKRGSWTVDEDWLDRARAERALGLKYVGSRLGEKYPDAKDWEKVLEEMEKADK